MGQIKSEQRIRNFKIAWIGTFMAGMAFSEAMPFLALYIMQISHFNQAQVSFYAGISYAASYLVVILVSPIWGKIADQHGRKPMLLRTAAGMGIVIILLSCVTNIWQIIILRLCQGLFDGYTPSVIALIAAETPLEERSVVISKLSTGYIIGGLMGPLIGGVLATIFSIRMTFFITGIILLCVAFISFYGIQENFQKINTSPTEKLVSSKKESVWTVPILILLSATMLIQFVESAIIPYVSLMIKDLLFSEHYLTIMTGIVSALPGVATAVFATFVGKMSSHFGTLKILKLCELAAIIIYALLGMTTSLMFFAGLRFLIGIANAGMTPMIQVLLSKASNRLSTVFSMSLSAQSLGSLAGSILGAYLSQFMPLNNLFYIASGALMISYVLLKKGELDNSTAPT
ncbi:MFS transporter [Leuconostoc mesenteroides]|uniref:Permease of the major facilitator superfamily n=2 Tax=Leuconostoc mesenteroides TaxID=1245 RepID=Q03WU3_LEUMM|nr:MFS transporter [Leuconostoc mesenteroides]ABJ62329.1 permease of the major facilitator superfamily [Leuconostoc mesenteroides subsp. mesenteroides ATCC 8293]MBA5973093.1 MFS transporter [Leuconostoc mesenteroides]MCT3042881.1 MFS transporter [Leuconostoc mesenteroides]MDG9747258.1 MFS transporter [Leuconostoc mesenteroides]QQB30884.1 MFS transporter [Leuconostoc mesenteroides]